MRPLSFFLLWLGLLLPAWSQPTLTEDAYRALAREHLAALERGLSADQAAAWERRWSAIKRVRCRDGRVLEPAPLRQRSSRERAQALAWLLRDTAPLPEKTDPKLLAKRILADPEYERARQKAPESPLAQWFRKQWETFVRWLQKLTPPPPKNAPDLSGAAMAVRVFLYIVAGLGVVGGLWLLLRHGSGWRWGRRVKPTVLETTALDDLTGAELPDPLGAAQAAAQAGEFRQAVRLAYIACLRRLRDASLLTLERHRTNGEYQTQLRLRDSATAQQLLPATQLYERVWYGGMRASAADVALLTAIFAALPEASE